MNIILALPTFCKSSFRCSSLNELIYFVVYVDDIDIDIKDLKQHLFEHLLTKDLGKLYYFLENEVAQSQAGIVVSHRKYALVMRMLDCKLVHNPMDPNESSCLDQICKLSFQAKFS